MVTDWENPRPLGPAEDRRGGFAGGEGDRPDHASGESRGEGVVDPWRVLRIVRRRVFAIAVTALVIFALLMGAIFLVPFPYKASALVFVDPRQQAVNPTQEVLPAIGTDSANLESVVQVVQSEGFLLALLPKLDLADDPAFAQASDPRERLKIFRKNLVVERRGATYLVDIAYKSGDADRAARYANAVARTFVEQQNGSRVEAAEQAASSLSSRLGELQQNLRDSELAVAEFKNKNDIVDVDGATTLSQRAISNVSQQISLAQARTAEAKARYENQLAAPAEGNSNDGSASASTELTLLQRDQRAMSRELASLEKTYGPRHPKITVLREQKASIDQQVAQERSKLLDSLKKVYDSALQEQRGLEAELDAMGRSSTEKGVERVKLADLERQAAANRAIYEQYLSRYKATDEQSFLPVDDVRIVSLAIAPLTTTRPSLVLIGAVFSVLALIAALLIIVTLSLRAGLEKPKAAVEDRSGTPSRSPAGPRLARPAGTGPDGDGATPMVPRDDGIRRSVVSADDARRESRSDDQEIAGLKQDLARVRERLERAREKSLKA